MNECFPPPRAAMSEAAVLRLVEIDELSDVRYVHAASVKALSAGQLSETEVEAFHAYVYSSQYTDRLAEMVKARRLFGAAVDGRVVATSGWMPANDSGSTVRLAAVFVSPLFSASGLGRLVALGAETHAAQAGFDVSSVRTPVGAVAFFQRIGYDVSSFGAWTLRPDCALPVAFMRKALGREKNGVPAEASDD